MKTVVLVACTKEKYKGTYPAGYIYMKSREFRKYMEYARLLTSSENIFVISALHGLLPLDTLIKNYEYALAGKPKFVKDIWGKRVAEQLKLSFDVSETMFVVLADANYFIPLMPHLPNMKMPLKNVLLGCRLSKIDELIYEAKKLSEGASTCYKLHRLFNSLPRYKWDTINRINFNNGIYIVFEKGETFYGIDRIVHVGTHRSDDRLIGKLKDHFWSANCDNSVIRKNIGRAILRRNNNPYLRIWTKS